VEALWVLGLTSQGLSLLEDELWLDEEEDVETPGGFTGLLGTLALESPGGITLTLGAALETGGGAALAGEGSPALESNEDKPSSELQAESMPEVEVSPDWMEAESDAEETPDEEAADTVEAVDTVSWVVRFVCGCVWLGLSGLLGDVRPTHCRSILKCLEFAGDVNGGSNQGTGGTT